MNLHLVINTPVYVDQLIDKTKELSKNKDVFITLKPIHGKGHIKSKKVQYKTLEEAVELVRKKKIRKVVIHFLDNPAIEFLKKIDSEVTVYWMFWGADGYRHPKLKQGLHLPKTQHLLDRLNKKSVTEIVKKRLKDIKLEFKLNNAFRRINYCCTQVKGDFKLVKSISNSFKMQHIYFAYKGIDSTDTIDFPALDSKKKISVLLGNSANSTNNHLDALDLLSGYKDRISRIICPLSYSGNSDYIKEVIKEGKRLFGESFIPLTAFLPYSQYLEMVETIDVGVFYHSRQQGYSNTLHLLCDGKKILMNNNSSLYKMYKDFGVENVYSNIDKLFMSKASKENLYQFLGPEVIDEGYERVLNY